MPQQPEGTPFAKIKVFFKTPGGGPRSFRQALQQWRVSEGTFWMDILEVATGDIVQYPADIIHHVELQASQLDVH